VTDPVTISVYHVAVPRYRPARRPDADESLVDTRLTLCFECLASDERRVEIDVELQSRLDGCTWLDLRVEVAPRQQQAGLDAERVAGSPAASFPPSKPP
jgi:hypothetical protein